MATEYIKNGNFINEFKYWTQDSEFALRFEPYQKGNCIYVPVGCNILQSIPDLPGKTMRIEFEVRSDQDVDRAVYVVAVGGVPSEGPPQVSPVPGLATNEWKKVSTRLYFPISLLNCFVTAGASVPDVPDGLDRSMWFSNFTLTEEPDA
ncbi:hypothetical protein [Pseudomonas sp. DSP3-2-2]|uniref:hypothetical protein n=1 Tax=unclassified Pseudomonas TaxID=196821 RepID=UPI003CFAD974